MDNTRYYLGFNIVNGIGPARIDRLIERCGTIEAAWHASFADTQAAGLDARRTEALLKAQRTLDLDAELERADRAGMELVTREHPGYPTALAHIPSPPPLLYVRGRLAEADRWSVAVVGTRSPTSYGKEATRRLAGELAEQIVASGALVSEFPIGTRPVPQLFPVRNRLISGLSLGTLVVEAGVGSGALITVDYALEQGRDVFAVPGSIFSKVSQGTNRLIRNGATIVTQAEAILDALNLTARATQQEIQTAFPDDPTELALLELISYEPQHVDELRRSSGLPIATVSSTLALLELKGLVRQAGLMQYVLAREERAEYRATTLAAPM